MSNDCLETLAAETKEKKREMEKARLAYYGKAGTYEAMLAAATVFCKAFETYHFAKTGKKKRLDPRAVLR